MTEQAFPPVTLIIPNFNGAHLLRDNLPPVLTAAQNYPGECAVIVVDDSSRDNSVTVLETEFPAVRLVRHEANRGFAEAIHSGVEAAASELLVFLNSDVRPDPDFIAPLVRHFASPEVFSVSPRVLEDDGTFSAVSWRLFRIRRGRFRAVPRPFDDTSPIPRKSLFGSGGSLMLRKSMFMALNGFLPIFKPFYYEDFDLGLRAWRRGWETLFEPASQVVHAHHGSIKENIAARRIRETRLRNRFLLEWMHIPARDLFIRMVPGYFLQSLGRLLKFNLGYFKALCAALRRLPEARRLRAEIDRSAVLGFRQILDAIEQDAGASPQNRLT